MKLLSFDNATTSYLRTIDEPFALTGDGECTVKFVFKLLDASATGVLFEMAPSPIAAETDINILVSVVAYLDGIALSFYYTKDGGTAVTSTTRIVVTANTWYQLTLALTSTGLTIYLNGTTQTVTWSSTGAVMDRTASTRMGFGGRCDGGAQLNCLPTAWALIATHASAYCAYSAYASYTSWNPLFSNLAIDADESVWWCSSNAAAGGVITAYAGTTGGGAHYLSYNACSFDEDAPFEMLLYPSVTPAHMLPDPLSRLYRGIWWLLEKNTKLTSMVRLKNRIQYDLKNIDPFKDKIAPADMPEIRVTPAMIPSNVFAASDLGYIAPVYDVEVTTGDNRIDIILNPLIWQLMVSIRGWTSLPRSCGFGGITRVHITSSRLKEGVDRGDNEGWVAIFRAQFDWYINSENWV